MKALIYETENLTVLAHGHMLTGLMAAISSFCEFGLLSLESSELRRIATC